MARDNPSWEYHRIQGVLSNLGYEISDTIVGNILIANGIEPAPERSGRFLDHFHTERNHQGLANRVIEPGEEVSRRDGEVLCRERLGGMLRYYYRKAA